MSQPLRKIVIVNTADKGSGAERVTMAVLDAFLELGLDAWLLVGNKKRNHARVIPFHSSPFFDYRPYAGSSFGKDLERRRSIEKRAGLEDFNHPYSHRICELTGSPPDLVLCQNLHGGYFDLRALAVLSRRVPVALSLFDTWLQTGHCAYSLDCKRWQTGCGECPDLTIPPAISRDASRANLRRKKWIFQHSRLFASAESQWMLDRAKRSVLAHAVIDWKHISGGVDLETFFPGPREKARRQVGLDADAKVLLYVATGGPSNPYKDFDTVRRAFAELNQERDRKIILVVVGSAAPEQRIGQNRWIRQVGHIASHPQLAAFYRAADVMVHSAIEETFGYAVAEALACGTPAILASGGGVLELVEHGSTGLIVPPGEPGQLAQAMSHLLGAPELCVRMGVAAAAAARRYLDSRVMIGKMQSWCTEVHSAWHARAAS